ncbi:MAG: trypsin-like peptidase domain-containing protein [Candidatus Marinimicrobia bacterium]|nr:trypsin-like peptidase domain-containing protein [Candidatus Neomarinimicrobiota bacterium]MCF7850696.1 trypsin-like peptidase domain-containing protein [Candidatus Neomarinimicrobiota bacterium]MCF7905160.1 trypsin-like peptidase domain-containing protein [Candidatus Neomarinimicrobiota bacterium]
MKRLSILLFAAALFLGMLTLTLHELRSWRLSDFLGDEPDQEFNSQARDIPLEPLHSVIPQELEWSRETAITKGISDVAPAVVGISATQIRYTQSTLMSDPFWRLMMPGTPRWFQEKGTSIGSGFIYDREGYIITNAHVVENPEQITVTLADGSQHTADLIGIDEKTDLALIKIQDQGDYPTVHLGNSDNIIMGEWVIALGNPFGLFSESRMPIATAGIISSLHMDFGFQQHGRVYQDMIQTDASINSGNSGGPLVNSQGEIIGINTFIFTGSNNAGSIGIGFALPINRAMDIIEELRNTGFVDRNFTTGMSYMNNNTSMAQLFNLSSTSGVLISRVKVGSPAERGGVLVGDLIIGLDGEGIDNVDDLFAYIIGKNLKRGDKLSLNILRQGARKDILIELGETESQTVN